MKSVIILLAALLVSACSTSEPIEAEVSEMHILCLENVEYYVFRERRGYTGWGYMSVKFNADGKVSSCEEF